MGEREDPAGGGVTAWGDDETGRRRREPLYRVAVDALEDWVHVVDDQLRLVLINASLRRICAELELPVVPPGRPLRELFPFLPPERLAEYAQVLATGTTVTNEKSIVIGGRAFVTESKKIPLLEGAKVTRVMTVVRDLTSLRHAEAARRTSEEQLQAVFASASDCIFIKDCAGRYTHVNPAMARLFKRPAEQLLGLRDADLFGGAAAAHIDAVDATVVAGETVEEEHVKPVHGTDHVFHVVKVPLRDGNGRIVGLCGIARDVTERTRAEAARQQLEARLLRSQAAESLGVLASGVAHDFNNLLTTILGNAELLLATLGSGANARRQLQKVVTSARRAADLTQQLLAYAGHGQFALERVDLSAMAGEMVKLLPAAAVRGRAITCELAPDVPAIKADPAQVRQMIMSCVLNACEACDGDPGTVTVRTGAADLDTVYLCRCTLGEELPAGRYAWVEVADTGCGIQPHDLGRIFDPFFTTKFAGRGLGLAAVLGIVRSLGGAIYVQSEPGRGTTVRLVLPPSPATAEAPRA